jgi:hypothetical protein
MEGGMAAVLPGVLSAFTNDERQAQNLQILKVNPILNKAAEMKANDMATNGYFAHTSPEGKTPWYWLEKVGYQYQYAGENLAVDFSDSKDVTDAWMKSLTHKANIVKGNYTEIGTGVASGMYEGRETIFVAQVYANPLPKTEVAIPSTKNVIIETEEKTPTVLVANEPTNILGAETAVDTENSVSVSLSPVESPTFWQKLFTSPRNTMNIVLLVAFGIIALSLVLYLFFIIKSYHLDLITNGLVVLAIIGVIFIANYYFSNRNMIITQSLDYSNESK